LFDPELLVQLTEAQQTISEDLTDLRVALHRCLGKADEWTLRLIALRYGHAMTHEQIASQTGKTSGAVRTAMHRIHAALLRCIRSQLGTKQFE
jgi:DNA-directed RNA polymerase specialized sigma24 family protein